MRVRDDLGELFADAEFAEAFGSRGRPGWSPGQLALVTVLQFAENLTDRAAAHRGRYGMDLKYALGLELDDPGFDASVLSEFRTRLVEHGMEEKVLDLLYEAVGLAGVLDDDPLVADTAERLALDGLAGQSVADQAGAALLGWLTAADLQLHELTRAHAGD
ncbi:transposase [Streptomyces sp. NPDC059122]|uniref:transposase n=1 Tax=Streptomyces sp. NPDC059122 TaxID=3346732 RepID=UPI003684F9B2